MIHQISTHADKRQIEEMLQALGTYIKLAVDIRRGVLAGGGELHADCESILLEAGSKQEDVWGADWIPSTQQTTYEALINIRPRQNNPAMEILDPSVRERVNDIVQRLLGGA